MMLKKNLLRWLALGSVAWTLTVLAWAGIPIQHWTMDSGAKIYLIESHGIPMVDVRIDFDAGNRRDPRDQAGLADTTAAMASKGLRAMRGDAADASPALDENALSEAWADLGASFGADASADRMGFSLRSLTYPDLLPRAVHLAARQLAQPAFPADVWQRERERLSASIRESKTQPASVAAQAYATAVYGRHPYGYQTTEESLARIGVADMQAMYSATIRPCRAKVSIVGDVTREQADAMTAQLFARIVSDQPGALCAALPPVAEVAPLAQAIERRIDFESAQAQVLIGQPGIRRNDSVCVESKPGVC